MSTRQLSDPPVGDPLALSAAQAAEAIRCGALSSSTLVEACLERIGARDDEIQAWVHLDPDLARAQARAADERLASGAPTGALNGVPVGVKDIFDTADLPTENGCPIFAGRQPSHDAACVALLRKAGAVILGKTVTTELALLTPAKTRNPHRLTHTPGGSSSGSAAAVAAAMVPAALGSQTAGSLIRPASYCGVHAFKPTLGLIPRAGVLMQSHTLDTVGVYGRSVEDLALLADCMSAFEAGDRVSYHRAPSDLLVAAQQAPPTPPRFAFVKTPAWADADPAMHVAYAELVAKLGDRVDEIEMPVLADVIAWQALVQLVENAYYYGPLMDDAPDKLSDGLKARIETGRTANVQDYVHAIVACDAAYRVVEEQLSGYDAILTPSATGPAPEGLGATGSPIFNGLWTYLGMPCVSLPLLETAGLPIGVQLVGLRRADGCLLRTACWLETHVAATA
jgi:Asp-tRNA(Asn)/Glu-tRNA(Gln) amidotransferase A subunit family amidase